jgi:hypothetical protein
MQSTRGSHNNLTRHDMRSRDADAAPRASLSAYLEQDATLGQFYSPPASSRCTLMSRRSTWARPPTTTGTPRQIAENVTGFFAILAEWSRAEVPIPANDSGAAAPSAGSPNEWPPTGDEHQAGRARS